MDRKKLRYRFWFKTLVITAGILTLVLGGIFGLFVSHLFIGSDGRIVFYTGLCLMALVMTSFAAIFSVINKM